MTGISRRGLLAAAGWGLALPPIAAARADRAAAAVADGGWAPPGWPVSAAEASVQIVELQRWLLARYADYPAFPPIDPPAWRATATP